MNPTLRRVLCVLYAISAIAALVCMAIAAKDSRPAWFVFSLLLAVWCSFCAHLYSKDRA